MFNKKLLNLVNKFNCILCHNGISIVSKNNPSIKKILEW